MFASKVVASASKVLPQNTYTAPPYVAALRAKLAFVRETPDPLFTWIAPPSSPTLSIQVPPVSTIADIWPYTAPPWVAVFPANAASESSMIELWERYTAPPW